MTKILKGTEDYKKAQVIARRISKLASYERWNNNSYFNIAFEELGAFILKIQKLGGFAAQVAETVDKSSNPYGRKVAYVSDKQAWILATAAVENGIELD